jgi:hypothetical protein
MTKEFDVHTEALKDVATQIQSLLDKINNDDASKGTYTQFKTASSIDGPTATFWDGPNALAEGYAHEYKYVCDTYDALIKQLNSVMAACSSTAQKYDTHEGDAKKDVTSSAPEFN